MIPSTRNKLQIRPDDVRQSGLAPLFAVLANGDRLAIVRELREREVAAASTGFVDGASIDELARLTDLTRFSASRHLAIMREAGLVDVSPQGHRRLHRLNARRLEDIEDWLYQVLDFTQGEASAGSV